MGPNGAGKLEKDKTCSDRSMGNGFKLHEVEIRLKLDIRNKF